MVGRCKPAIRHADPGFEATIPISSIWTNEGDSEMLSIIHPGGARFRAKVSNNGARSRMEFRTAKLATAADGAGDCGKRSRNDG